MSSPFATVRPPLRWRWFSLWAVVGMFFAVGAISYIGIILLPLAIVGVVIVSRSSGGRGVFGLIAGFGGAPLLVGLLNLGSHPCPSSATPVLNVGQSYSCGGLDPQPWLVAGALLVLLGTVGHVLRPTLVHDDNA